MSWPVVGIVSCALAAIHAARNGDAWWALLFGAWSGAVLGAHLIQCQVKKHFRSTEGGSQS